MKHQPPMTPEQERQMLEHFRTHAQGEPSAALDARILAAARAAIEQRVAVEKERSLAARIKAWLFAGRGQQRWSLALAGVACLGVAVSLTWRQFEPASATYDAVPASAVMPAAARQAPIHAPLQMAAPAPEMRARVAKPDAVFAESFKQERLSEVSPQHYSAAAAGAPVAPVASADEAQMTDLDAAVMEQLKELLQLREDGKSSEAEVLKQKIQRENPDLDIEVQLHELQKSK
ncbi:hypothetical protein [Pseudomonas sp. TTU2014-080ASC]|uniref:hypothetical protein n=1 Tax=Pseudomonas sp. TTU2014-080ASC TaxID=1729724 RepID=UPI0007185CE4|nr:hypothetical protein [Pseudomonas sp. TTU2014-080ASC]KRW62050.1 hypothetical protein AO726_01100 [Pseudomonas sp. TTU2014-080ASC]